MLGRGSAWQSDAGAKACRAEEGLGRDGPGEGRESHRYEAQGTCEGRTERRGDGKAKRRTAGQSKGAARQGTAWRGHGDGLLGGGKATRRRAMARPGGAGRAMAKRWLAWRWRGAWQHREAMAYQGVAGHGWGMAFHRGAAARQSLAWAWHSTTWQGRSKARRCGGKAKQDVAAARLRESLRGQSTGLLRHCVGWRSKGIAKVGIAARRHCTA